MVLWSILIYSPIAHIMWQSDGWFFRKGILDFAGGTVVHINAGIAGLVCCLVLGKRMGYPKSPMPPHNLVLSVIGASLLWVGWFGFNAGSALTSGGRAGMAMTVTQIATGGSGPRLDVRRVDGEEEAVGARHHLGCRRRPCRHHPGLGLRRRRPAR